MASDMFNALDTIRVSKNYNQWIFSQIQDFLRGKVLDIGTGLGNIVHLYNKPSIDQVVMSDYSEEMLAYLDVRFQDNPKYSSVQLDISQPLSNQNLEEEFDVITCINVLEHIEDDQLALQNMHKMLKPGGCVLLMVPALQALYGTLDSLVDHYRRYQYDGLKKLFEHCGYGIERLHYMNLFGVVTWFINGRVIRCKKFNPRVCGVLDKVVPFLSKLENCYKPPIGQSLICIARRPY